MLVRALLEEACYLSIADRIQQPAISPNYLSASLNSFNLLLDEFRDRIPYEFEYRFDNVDDLENTSFVQIDNMTFIINKVASPLMPCNLTTWKALSAVEGLTGFPTIYFFDESTQSIHVYPKPSQPSYAFVVNGRRALGNVELGDSTPANMPSFMINALIYEMAYRLCGQYNVPWNQLKENTRQVLLSQLDGKQVIDLSPRENLSITQVNRLSKYPFPMLYYMSGGS